jgi:hypothetical protein
MISVGPPLTVTPGTTFLAPRGMLQIMAAGGAPDYAFSLSTNNSGGTINPTTGEYTAGSTANVRDVVTVTDSNGATETVAIDITAGVSITPDTPTVAPGGKVTLAAAGGSGSGFTWRLAENGAGGSIDPATGVYSASKTPAAGGTDVAEATDSLGNTAQVTIHLTATRISASGGSRGCASAGGGLPDPLTIGLALLALALVMRRRARRA